MVISYKYEWPIYNVSGDIQQCKCNVIHVQTKPYKYKHDIMFNPKLKATFMHQLI